MYFVADITDTHLCCVSGRRLRRSTDSVFISLYVCLLFLLWCARAIKMLFLWCFAVLVIIYKCTRFSGL